MIYIFTPKCLLKGCIKRLVVGVLWGDGDCTSKFICVITRQQISVTTLGFMDVAYLQECGCLCIIKSPVVWKQELSKEMESLFVILKLGDNAKSPTKFPNTRNDAVFPIQGIFRVQHNQSAKAESGSWSLPYKVSNCTNVITYIQLKAHFHKQYVVMQM